MATTYSTLYQYAQRRLGNRSDDSALVIAKETVNDAVRYLAEEDHEYFRERGYVNIPAPFTSGTVSVDADGTYCSLSSGGSWSSTYSGWMIRIADKKVSYEATITSNPARITFGKSAAWGYSSQTDETYSLYKFKYDLPDDCRKIGEILDEEFLGSLTWLDNINAFEKQRLQTYSNSGDMTYACMYNNQFMVWPYKTDRQVIPIAYYRWPVDMSSDSDTMDYPDTGGQLNLVKRAIDYFVAIAEDDEAKETAALRRLMIQKERTQAYSKRGKDGLIEWAPASDRIVRVTKIVGSDD